MAYIDRSAQLGLSKLEAPSIGGGLISTHVHQISPLLSLMQQLIGISCSLNEAPVTYL